MNRLCKRILSVLLAIGISIGGVPAVKVQAAAVNDYTQWRQSDPEWNRQQAWPANEYPKATAHTMAAAGCLVTSVAMLLRHYNVVTDGNVNNFNPWICNERLKSVKAFDNAADLQYGAVQNAYPGFAYAGIEGYSLSRLTQLYNQGYACIVKVNGSGGYFHYVAVKSVSGSTVTIMDPGPGYTNLNSYADQYEIVYFKTSKKPNNAPIGCIDHASGGPNCIQVSGWALDQDAPTTPIAVHVYVGGPAGSGAPGYGITANKTRADVGAAYPGTGNNHGFSDTIYTNRTGTQTLYFYAIDSAGGTNSLIGTKTVNIISDTKDPVIADVKVTDVSAKGYTITCTVTDENGIDRVQFPTWTAYNSQDDLVAGWENSAAVRGTMNGNTVTFRVNASEHNNETGLYYTHIYAYGKDGRRAVARVSADVKDEEPIITPTPTPTPTETPTPTQNPVIGNTDHSVSLSLDGKILYVDINGIWDSLHMSVYFDSEKLNVVEYGMEAGFQGFMSNQQSMGTSTMGTGEYAVAYVMNDGAVKYSGHTFFIEFDTDEKVAFRAHDYLKDEDITITYNPDNVENPIRYAYGDVNMDGKIAANDALEVLRHVVRLSSIADVDKKELADITHDSIIDAEDALEILKVTVQLRNKEYIKL